MKRHLFIVDGEYRSVTTPRPWFPMPYFPVSPEMQAAYEFGRQEKAQEILESLTREFFGKEKP